MVQLIPKEPLRLCEMAHNLKPGHALELNTYCIYICEMFITNITPLYITQTKVLTFENLQLIGNAQLCYFTEFNFKL